MSRSGRLYGIGIGPGDTDLLTVKAVNTLNSVDLIFSPRPAPKRDSLARKIIEPVIKNGVEIRELTFPMTKDRDELKKHWSSAATEVADFLKSGKDAAFVTLGDPLFYSTYIYLHKTLKEMYPSVDIVTLPGISSVFASASAAGIPIAVGDERVAIIPLPEDAGTIKKYLEMFDTIIILKVGEKLHKLIDVLTDLGLSDNAVLVQKVSQVESERVIYGLSGLSESDRDRVGYLSTVIVKRDVRF